MKRIIILCLFCLCLVGCKSKDNNMSLEEYNKKVNFENFTYRDYSGGGFGGFSIRVASVTKIINPQKDVYIPATTYINEEKYDVVAVNAKAFINDNMIENLHFYPKKEDESFTFYHYYDIDSYAFYNCENLTNVENPYFRDVSEYAFYNTNISAEKICVLEVGNYAFANIKGEIELIDFTEGTGIYISSHAFFGSNIKEIIFDKDILHIAKDAFDGLSKDTKIRFKGTKEEFIEVLSAKRNNINFDLGVDKIYVNDGIVYISELIKNDPFELKSTLNGVTYEYVDGNYKVVKVSPSLNDINIEASFDDGIHGKYPVVSIATDAFVGKYGKILLPETIKTLEVFAFNEAEINNINLNYIEYIYDYAFNLTKFNNVIYLDNLVYASDFAFCINKFNNGAYFAGTNNGTFVIGANSIPNIAVDMLPEKCTIVGDFSGRMSLDNNNYS